MTQRFLVFILLYCPIGSLARAAEPQRFWLHLPGIGGHRFIDDLVTTGLELGGVHGDLLIDDWTIGRTGLGALTNYPANQLEAQRVANELAVQFHIHPQEPILITSHSGGTGIAIFALEKLPADVHVQTLVMLASALSPSYDMSRALAHVDGKVYVLVSPLDEVVGLGTQKFGTIDRVYSAAIGKVGFVQPPAASAEQYKKLVTVPYDARWVAEGNYGDHIGPMQREFAADILAPLLLTGKLPPPPATMPTTGPTTYMQRRFRPATIPASAPANN